MGLPFDYGHNAQRIVWRWGSSTSLQTCLLGVSWSALANLATLLLCFHTLYSRVCTEDGERGREHECAHFLEFYKNTNPVD